MLQSFSFYIHSKPLPGSDTVNSQWTKHHRYINASTTPTVNTDGGGGGSGDSGDDDVDNIFSDSTAVKEVVDGKKFADKACQLRKNSLPWSLPKARERKKITTVIGDSVTSTLEGVAPIKRDFWELSVSRLKEDVTPEKIKTHLQSHLIEVKDVFVFASKIKGTAAAKVRVDIAHKEKAKAQSVWPLYVRVQDWIYKPKSSKK